MNAKPGVLRSQASCKLKRTSLLYAGLARIAPRHVKPLTRMLDIDYQDDGLQDGNDLFIRHAAIPWQFHTFPRLFDIELSVIRVVERKIRKR